MNQKRKEDEDQEGEVLSLNEMAWRNVINSFPTYEDYVSGKIKAIGFLHHSKENRTMYMWTTVEEDTEVDQAYFEEHCSRGDFDTIAIFKLDKIIKWENKRGRSG